jgi:hypothetical protein
MLVFNQRTEKGLKMGNPIIIKDQIIASNEIVARDMPLGSIGRVIGHGEYFGLIVRRTYSTTFVIENLSDPGPEKTWSGSCSLRIQLLPDAEIRVILK